MARIGFLHTSPVHVATFTGLVAGESPEASTTHSVREDLLERAMDGGVTNNVRSELGSAIDSLRSDGADVVICTCSTLGPAAEEWGDDVIRIDRPMMAEACSAPSHLVVLYTLEATRQPALSLLREEISRVDYEIEWNAQLVEGAWDRFLAADIDGYLDAVAAWIDGLDPGVDSVVLAQTSMAPAANRIERPRTVYSSARPAVRAALALATRSESDRFR